MKKTLLALLTFILTAIIFSNSAQAKSVIKRIEPEMASSKTVAMALETYDGTFLDLDEISKVKKTKGNVQQILEKGVVKLKTGGDVDVNSIRYFFVQSKTAFRLPSKIAKKPSEEE